MLLFLPATETLFIDGKTLPFANSCLSSVKSTPQPLNHCLHLGQLTRVDKLSDMRASSMFSEETLGSIGGIYIPLSFFYVGKELYQKL